MPARPRCSSLPSQTAPNGSGEPNARAPAGRAPEPLRKLQQRLRGAAVLQADDGLVLLRRQRRRDRHAAEQRGRQRENRVVAVDLRERAVVLHADADDLAAVRQRDDVGVEVEAIAERRRERRGEPIVASLDAIHGAGRRRLAFRELIDERDERQLVGIGEKKSAEAGRGRPQLRVGLHLIQPMRHRAPREIGGDRRIPAPFGQRVRPGEAAQLVGQALPAALGIAGQDLRAAGLIRTDIAEAAPENVCQPEPELRGEIADLVLFLIDHVAAGLGVLAFGKAVPDCPDASAHAVADVNHGDGGAQRDEIASRGEPGEARARHQHGDAAQSRIVHASTLNGNPRRMG